MGNGQMKRRKKCLRYVTEITDGWKMNILIKYIYIYILIVLCVKTTMTIIMTVNR